MSQTVDSILERLDRFEERLDTTGRNLKQQVDQKIGLLKRKVRQVRNGILRGRASTRESRRDLQLASDLLPSEAAVTYQDYVATRPAIQNDPASQQGEPAPSTSTGGKRKHASSRRRDIRRQNNRGEDEDGENPNSGVYKLNVRNQNCPKGCQGLTLQTRKQYHDHLHKEHGLLPHKCLQRGCGQRFRNGYVAIYGY